MALDPSGTGQWYNTMPDQPPASTCAYGELSACFGVPDNASGFDGDIRVDLANGDIYAKSEGFWVKVEGGGGGGGGGGPDMFLHGAGSPVGVVSPTAIDALYRDTTGPGFWQATGATNQDWIPWAGGG